MTLAEGFVPWLMSALALLGCGRGLPLILEALRRREHDDAPLLLIRGAQWFIAGGACVFIAVGHVVESPGLLLFGIAFLAEEIYETTLVLWILQWGRRRGLI